MNRDDIIRMAREANLHWYANELNEESFFEIVERFATLVAAAEREAYQHRIDTLHNMYTLVSQQRDELMAQQRAQCEAIRARGNHD